MTAAPTLDYLLIERALSGSLPIDRLNLEETDFYEKYKPAFDVGRLANRMAQGYYAFLVAQLVAANPQSINSLPPAKALGEDPTGEVKRKDGTAHTLNLRHYLDLFREDHGVQREVLQSWATGALLTLDVELSPHKYFDHAPVLELVYHLRNAVAHGNRFNITPKGRDRLKRYPAHNRSAPVKSPVGTVFEITPSLSGPLLFDFMGPGDVLDLLQAVEVYLTRIRERHAAGELSGLLR